MEITVAKKKTRKEKFEERAKQGIRQAKGKRLWRSDNPPEDLVVGYRFERRDVTGYGGKDEGFV